MTNNSPEMIAALVTAVQAAPFEDLEDLEYGGEFFGYQALGRGIARIAFDLEDGTIIKVLWNTAKQAQMEREYRTWKNAPDSLKYYLMPIVEADTLDFNWVIMPKADYVGCEENDEQELIDAGCAYGIGDIHPGNIGYYNDRPVILDYGF